MPGSPCRRGFGTLGGGGGGILLPFIDLCITRMSPQEVTHIRLAPNAGAV